MGTRYPRRVPSLVDHVNVYRSCLALLAKHGWQLRIEPGPYEAEDARLDTYQATRDGTTLEAATPLQLLGLAALHDHHHPHDDAPYWWRIPVDEEWLKRLENDALERAFDDYRRRDEAGWRACVVAALKAARQTPSIPAHERLGVSEATLGAVLRELPALSAID